MMILSKEHVAEIADRAGFPERRLSTWGQILCLCDTAELGLRAIEVLRRLDEIDDGSPITDRFGDHLTHASEELETILNDAAAIVAET